MQRPHCDKHPDTPAMARCTSCGKYLCVQCVVEISARAFCSQCAKGELQRRETADATAQPPDSDLSQSPQPSPFSQPPPSQSPYPPPGGTQAAPGGGPVGARMVATCAFHPGVRAVTRCSSCGALICAGCQRIMNGKRFCGPCFQRMYAPGPVGLPAAKAAFFSRGGVPKPEVPWQLWPGLAFLPIPFILSGVMTYMMRQGEKLSVGAAQILLSLLLYSCTLAFAFIIVSHYGNPLEEMGLHARNLPASLGLGFLGGSLAFWLAVAGGSISVGILERFGWLEEWLRGFFDVNVKNATGTDLLIAGLIIIVAAPICEEIFFRGYLYPAMRKRLGLWGAVVLNGFIFSAVHFSLFGLLGRTLAGIIFCMLYEYNDNLWSPIMAHGINNFVAFFLPLAFIWS